MKTSIAACATALVLTLMGCATATHGNDFVAVNVAQMQPGRSTIGDASRLLGRAPDVSHVGQGGVVQTWTFISSSANGFTGRVETTSKSLTLMFGQDGVFQRLVSAQNVPLKAADQVRLIGPR